MDRVYLVKPQPLINAIAETLKHNQSIKLPENHDIIKLGCGRSHGPLESDWFYFRMAAIVRQAMLKGKFSLKSLAKRFGNRKNRGVKPSRKTHGSYFVNGSAVDQLIKIGWIDFQNKEDVLTTSAKDVLEEIIEKVME